MGIRTRCVALLVVLSVATIAAAQAMAPPSGGLTGSSGTGDWMVLDDKGNPVTTGSGAPVGMRFTDSGGGCIIATIFVVVDGEKIFGTREIKVYPVDPPNSYCTCNGESPQGHHHGSITWNYGGYYETTSTSGTDRRLVPAR